MDTTAGAASVAQAMAIAGMDADPALAESMAKALEVTPISVEDEPPARRGRAHTHAPGDGGNPGAPAASDPATQSYPGAPAPDGTPAPGTALQIRGRASNGGSASTSAPGSRSRVQAESQGRQPVLPVPHGVVPPYLHHQLCRELAQCKGVKGSRSKLAAKYGVERQYITDFARRNKARIEEIYNNLDNELAGQWIAEKRNRIEAYKADYEAIQGNTHHEWVKARTAILRNVAEELGQLPPRQQAVVIPVEHVIVGVDLDQL